MTRDDYESLADKIGAYVNAWNADGKSVTIWLSTGGSMKGVTNMEVSGPIVKVERHGTIEFRLRADVIIGATYQ
jgi:hypothetical protein